LNIKECYIGHTTNFKTRKQHHKQWCLNENGKHYNLYVYQFIRANGGWDNWDMILIETSNCENKLEARKREREFIESQNGILNMIKRPYATEEERKDKVREWNENNKEHRNELLRNINQRLRKQHPERFKEYDKKKWKKHKERIQAKQKQIIECQCGSKYQHCQKARHCKTKKHQEYLNNNIENVSSTQEETNNAELQKTNEQASRETIGAGDIQTL